jgi:hypothetical protein
MAWSCAAVIRTPMQRRPNAAATASACALLPEASTTTAARWPSSRSASASLSSVSMLVMRSGSRSIRVAPTMPRDHGGVPPTRMVE